ncbi:MAG: histidine kinase, partial [Solirubrobacterales bacterium]
MISSGSRGGRGEREQAAGSRSSSRLRPAGEMLRPALALIGVTVAFLAGIETVLLIDAGFEPGWLLPAFPLSALIYAAAGLYAWARRPSSRIGALLVAGSLAFIAAGLAETAVPALIAVGLIAATVMVALIVHLLVAFPSGRLRDRASWAIVLAAYFVCLVLQAPVYLFDQGAEGPTTVLQIADRPDLGHVGFWVQTGIGSAAVVAAAVLLVGRLRRAEPAKRRVLAPLYLYGIFAVLFVPASGSIGHAWFPDQLLALGVIQLAVLAVIPLAFLAAVLRGGFARTGEIEELGAWLAAEQGRPALEAALREALGDPSLALLFWVSDPPGYVDGDGAPVAPPDSGSERATSEVALGGRRVGAIVYDASLVGDPRLVAEAAPVIALALDHERLTAELLASREGLRLSRARLVAATDAERRRIARDLHDGLQTRLVLLTMTAGRAREDETAAAELGGGLEEAIVELRELVQGVVPAVLTERGLYAAAEELTDRMPIPVVLDLHPSPEPLPTGVETAGYFVVSEALSNAVKHARAEELRLSIGRRNGHLRIEIADDGVGG